MINGIINGIAAAIHEEFGDRHEIYAENVEQGLTEPCFLITCVSPKNEQFLGRRYLREHLFLVQYFPESGEEPRRECMETQERLYEALEFITVDGHVKNGTRMEGEFLDGVLRFQVKYDFFVERKETGEWMETLSQRTEVKDGRNNEKEGNQEPADFFQGSDPGIEALPR